MRTRLLLDVWAFVVLGLLVRAFAGALIGATMPPAFVATAVRIDVNRATLAELTVLPGIGRARAEAIVLSRVREGPFRSLDDLGRVDGLGASRLELLRGAITFGQR
jgi:competence protein ComEA